MSRLHLVRHGPTHAKTMVGWSDLPADLSDTRALHRLAKYLPADAVVISSDLLRAVQTADAIAGSRQRLLHDPDLREIHFGAWELRSWKEIDAESPDHIRQFWENPGHVAPPNGESWNALRSRCDRAVDHLLNAHKGRDIVIVCHFGAILTQVQRAEGLSASAAFGHKIDNLSVTDITVAADGWTLGRLNHRP
ncbi:MAG: histidine phosphatase family protein [Rhodobacteraceae bacterium]|nr:histidine phosphatase family protein [Paracoccaceae bacterium]